MNVRKVRLAGLGALLAMTAVAGGCGGTDPVEEAKPLAPRDALLAALPDAKTGSFRFTAEGGAVATNGEIDAARHSYRLGLRFREPDVGFTMLSDYLVVDKQAWTRISFTDTEGLTGLPKLPKKWMLLDPAKVKNKDIPLAYADETDPGEVGELVRAAVDVQQPSPGHFTGTTDLTQLQDEDVADAARLRALGPKAKAVPFEATVDSQGRLTSTVVRIPAAGKVKASRYAITYADFGKVPTLTAPPADQQQPATKGAYDLLNA